MLDGFEVMHIFWSQCDLFFFFHFVLVQQKTDVSSEDTELRGAEQMTREEKIKESEHPNPFVPSYPAQTFSCNAWNYDSPVLHFHFPLIHYAIIFSFHLFFPLKLKLISSRNTFGEIHPGEPRSYWHTFSDINIYSAPSKGSNTGFIQPNNLLCLSTHTCCIHRGTLKWHQLSWCQK